MNLTGPTEQDWMSNSAEDDDTDEDDGGDDETDA